VGLLSAGDLYKLSVVDATSFAIANRAQTGLHTRSIITLLSSGSDW
jgi:hypothetical protein